MMNIYRMLWTCNNFLLNKWCTSLGLKLGVTGVSDDAIPQDKPNPLSHSYTKSSLLCHCKQPSVITFIRPCNFKARAGGKMTIYLVCNKQLTALHTLLVLWGVLRHILVQSSSSCLCNCYAQSFSCLSHSPGGVIHSVIYHLLLNPLSITCILMHSIYQVILKHSWNWSSELVFFILYSLY